MRGVQGCYGALLSGSQKESRRKGGQLVLRSKGNEVM